MSTATGGFGEVFAGAPAGRLPGAPFTVPGSLIDLVYGRPEGHVVEFFVALAGVDGMLEYVVDTPSDTHGGVVALQFAPAATGEREDYHCVRVFLPRVDARGGLHLALLSSRADLLRAEQAPVEGALLTLAAELATALDAEAGTALAPEIAARSAQWAAGAAGREAQKAWQSALDGYDTAIRQILAGLVGETIRVETWDHGYRSTGVLQPLAAGDLEAGRGTVTYTLSLPPYSRGKAKHSFWQLAGLEVRRPGDRFERVPLPDRPVKPDQDTETQSVGGEGDE